jgi:hypothetical protein
MTSRPYGRDKGFCDDRTKALALKVGICGMIGLSLALRANILEKFDNLKILTWHIVLLTGL